MKSVDGRFRYLDLNGMPVPTGTSVQGVHRFEYQCRKNPQNRCSLNLRGRGHDITDRSWNWDGNVDRPTLVPSINCSDCWHGSIEDGEFRNTQHIREAVQ